MDSAAVVQVAQAMAEEDVKSLNLSASEKAEYVSKIRELTLLTLKSYESKAKIEKLHAQLKTLSAKLGNNASRNQDQGSLDPSMNRV